MKVKGMYPVALFEIETGSDLELINDPKLESHIVAMTGSGKFFDVTESMVAKPLDDEMTNMVKLCLSTIAARETMGNIH